MDHHEASSLDMDHHSIQIIMRHHHWIWIITRSRSSLAVITGCRSSLNMDHHWIWIITRSGSSLVLSHDSSHHRKFYRASPFSCWLQAQPPCRSSSALIFDLLVRKEQHSYPSRLEYILHTMMEEFHTSIQAGTHPAHNDGRFLYFQPGWNHIL